MKNIAIIEDEDVLRERFVKFINSFKDITCTASAPNIATFLDSPKHSFANLNLLFLDITLDGENCIADIPNLRKKCPKAEIVMFTVSDSDENLFRALRAGASGYLVKSGSLLEIRKQVDIFLEGGAIMSPQMAKYLVDYFKPIANMKDKKKVGNMKEKDQQVLQLLAEGYSYDDISVQMSCSINNVRYYIKKLYRVLGVDNKIAALRRFEEMRKD